MIVQSLKKQINRAWWHFNRTPFIGIVKAALRVVNGSEIVARRKLGLRLQTSVPENFDVRGYADITVRIDDALRTELMAYGKTAIERGIKAQQQTTANKSFWLRLSDADQVNGQFLADHILVRFALQPAVLGAVAAILDEAPKLQDVLLSYSQPSAAPLATSQLWHYDYDDPRTIKVFMYLTDVNDQADGPFTFIPKNLSARFRYPLKSHNADAVVFARVPPEAVTSITAQAGAAFIVETSRCLHMGSRLAEGHSRLMYTATFLRAPRLYPETSVNFSAAGASDDIAQLVLGVR